MRPQRDYANTIFNKALLSKKNKEISGEIIATRATQLDALLGQWDTHEAMLQQYTRETGSMTEKIIDSWAL